MLKTYDTKPKNKMHFLIDTQGEENHGQNKQIQSEQDLLVNRSGYSNARAWHDTWAYPAPTLSPAQTMKKGVCAGIEKPTLIKSCVADTPAQNLQTLVQKLF